MEEKEYVVSEVMTMFQDYRSYKQPTLQQWRLIRSLYKGLFWEVFKKHLKDYSLTPDWNYFEYVVQAFSNSVYSGAFIGTVTPVREEDTQNIQNLNAFVRYQWGKWGMKNKFLHIGENGELYNLGAIRVDWGDRDVRIKALSPDEVYLDPTTDNYKEGAAVFIERAVNIDTLKLDKDYTEGVEQYLKDHKKKLEDKTAVNRMNGYENISISSNRTVSLIEAFIRNAEGGIDQVHILDETTIIYTNHNIKPNRFPVVIYSPQRPDGNPYGTSKLTKVMNTVVVLNLLDSMEATQPYRLLNRVRFVNIDGRINMRSFADNGSTPGATFETKGDPKGIIYYEDVPTIPDQTSLKSRLENSIFQVTGVDAQYKGRTTNSLQTTGATQAFQARVTQLTDNSRITQLEEFTEDLTKLVLELYLEYGGSTERKVPKLSATGTNTVVGMYKLKFSEMKKSKLQFDFTIAASTLLPMNQANLFDSAKALYEMQGQYGLPEIISAEDLINFSDFPQKDLWLQRLAKMKQESTAENLVADLTNFASIFSNFLSKGMSEEQAAQQAITVLLEEKNEMQRNPSVGQGFK